MAFNPKIYHRKSIRLKGYDYPHNGAYFVTLCSYEKECIFSTVEAGLASALHPKPTVQLKDPGKIIHKNWNRISERFENVQIDDLVIMLNHIHGILFIRKSDKRVDSFRQKDQIIN